MTHQDLFKKLAVTADPGYREYLRQRYFPPG